MINCLVSYHYMTTNFLEVIKATQGSIRWFLDSGAFSAHTLNKSISLREYCDFLHENKHLFWQYIALDSIGNVEQTKVNIAAMVKEGLKPMPVLVLNAPIKELNYFKEINNHICIAGGGSMNMKKYSTRLSQARKIVGNNTWLHGLAFGRGMKIASTQVNSVDVSTWMAGRRFGDFIYHDPIFGPKTMSWKKARTKPFKSLPIAMKKAIMKIDLSDINNPSMNRGSASMISSQSVYAYLQFASALQKNNKRFYYACSSVKDVVTLLLVLNYATNTALNWKKIQQVYEAKTLNETKVFAQFAKRACKNNFKFWGIK